MATDYVFAVFLKELKKAWRKDKAQDIIISTLFDAVIISGGLVDQYKDRLVVNKTYASLVFNRKPGGNVKQEILEHIDDESVKKNLPGHFEKEIIKKAVGESGLDGLVHRLNEKIQADDHISEKDRETAEKYAQDYDYSHFLALAFILSLQNPNVPERNASADYSDLSVDEDLAVLYEKWEKVANRRVLQRLEKPEIPDTKEAPYISELYGAYASYMNGPVHEKTDLTEELQEDFEGRRDDFYAAETVRLQGVGIMCGLTTDEFERLKDETCSIVGPTNRKALLDRVNGFDCMMRVMDKAETVTPANNLFCRAGYVGPVENRGICQMLAGEKKLHWVKKHE